MKKVLSFCFLSVLLAVLSVGLKAQSALVLDPANMPAVVVGQYDTINISAGGCFDALGLSDDARISIEWQVLYGGSVIPDDSLSYYFKEFKLESRYDLGMTEQWWGSPYTSDYCNNGDGHGSYPGAYTPTGYIDLGQPCERLGHFGITPQGQTNPTYLDYFNVRWFKNPAYTSHRLVYNVKVDGDYQFVFSIATRTGGTEKTQFKIPHMENKYIGGHGSHFEAIVASDTLHGIGGDDVRDYYRCLGDSLVIGNPPVTFLTTTDTAGTPGYDSVFYMGSSSCGTAIDSIVRFRVFFEDPSVPVLDTLHSTLALCDSGEVSIKVTLTAADKSIWLDGTSAVLDTLDAGVAFTHHINANTTFKVLGYNSASGCVSSDTLTVYAKVFASPNPTLTAADDSICENSALKITLDNRYDARTWFHDGINMHLDTVVYDVTDVSLTDTGSYWVSVVENHLHAQYPTVDTIRCSANSDTVHIVVFPRPSVAWASLDGDAAVDSTFCPSDLSHVLVATISGGQVPYDSVRWIGFGSTEGTKTYNADKSSDTLSFTLAATCNKSYTTGINYAVDAHGCVLKDSVKITFNVIDTVAPTITKMGDTVSAPAYANCEYIIPDVRGYIVASDNCIISDTIQVPAAGQHVTTDTIVVVTVIDSCGNTASDTIRVNLPVHTLPHVEWASLDNDVVTDSLMFCPTDLEHMVVATVTGGQPNYKNIHWTGYAGTATYNADKSSDTLRFTLPGDCGRTYTVGIDNLLDTNGCALENTIELTFFVNDTVKPHVSKTINDTVSAPSYANCEYVLPDLRSFITVTDGCDTIADTIQVPAAGQLVTTDTIVRIIVHDLCGNADTVAIDVNLPVEQLAFDTIKVTKTVECAGDANGAIRIVVKNGNPPYDVRIQSVENTSIVDSLHGTADQVAFDFTGLVKGKWNITVTDTNGCQIYAPDTADVASPNVLTLVITDSVNLTCYGSENGAITYRVSQGTAPYSMTIAHTFNSVTDTLSPSPLVLHPSALDTIVEMTNLKAGEYVITVEDSNHCKDVKTVTLTQPDSLKLEGVTVLNHVKCFGDSLGNLAVTGVTGGTYPYHYAWVNTAGDTVNTDSVTGRKIPYGIDGIYTMYVTDANNCAPDTVLSDTIKQPDTLKVVSIEVPVADTCPRLHTYAFNATVEGGRTNYEFEWKFNNEVLKTTSDVSIVTDTFRYVEANVSCDTLFNIVFTVTDDSNCVATGDITFRIADTVDPVLSGILDTLYVDGCAAAAAGDTLLTIADLKAAGLTVYDNCTDTAALTLNFDEVVTGTCPIEVVRTYSVTDSCGRTSAEVKHVIYVQDTMRPTYERPADTILYLSETCTVITDTNTVGAPKNLADNCTPVDELVITYRDEVVNGCGSTYTISRYWRVVDACGNVSLSDSLQTIQVLDSIKPRFTHMPESFTTPCDPSNAGDRADYERDKAYATVWDNCTTLTRDSIVMTLDSTVRGCNSATKTYYYSFIITDACQNADTAYATFSIYDSIKPEFIDRAPSVILEQCTSEGILDTLVARSLAQFTYTDDCEGQAYFVKNWLDTIPGCGRTGTYTHYVVITDSCMQDTASHTIIIEDIEPPIIYAPRQTGLAICDGKGNLDSLFAWVYSVTAEDACGGPTDSILIYYRNMTSGEYELFDTAALKLHKDADGHLLDAWDTLGSMSRCDGLYHFKWEAIDDCGNRQPAEEGFRIIDNQGPVFAEMPQDTVVDACDHSEAAFYEWVMRVAPNAYDTCDRLTHLADTITNGISFTPKCGSTGFYTVTWRAEDNCGNLSDIMTAKWTIIDTTAPVVTTTDPYDNLVNDTLYFGNDADWTEPQIKLWSKSMNDKATSDNFIIDVINHNDIEGNDHNMHRINAGITDIEECGYIKTFRIANKTLVSDALCEKIYNVEYIFVDACNNEDTLTQEIVIRDTTPPFVFNIEDTMYMTSDCAKEAVDTFKTITELEAYTPNASAKAQPKDRCFTKDPSVKDDAARLSLISVVTTKTATCDSVEVRTYRISDACGNDTTFTHTIIYLDTITPVISPTVLYDTIHQTELCNTYSDMPDKNTELTDYTYLQSNYAGFTITSCHDYVITFVEETEEQDENVCPGKVLVEKYKVTKDCGTGREYAAYFTVRLIVKDTIAPKLDVANLTSDTVYTNDDCDYVVPNVHFTHYTQLTTWQGADVVTDCNLGETNNVTMYDSTIVGSGCEYEIHYRYTVADSCGNMSDTIRLTLVVMDTLAPKIEHDTATLADTVYFTAHNCVFPDLTATYWTTPQVAIDHGVEMSDCNAKWEDAANMMRYDANDTADLTCATFVTVKYAVKDSCGNKWSDTIYQRILVLDTIAPTKLMTELRGDTIYTDNSCAYDITSVNVLFANYGDMTTWQGADVYQDCNIDNTCNVSYYGPEITVDGCDTVYTYKYTVADLCNNMSYDTVKLAIRVMDTLPPYVTVDTAPKITFQYYESDCSNPELKKWATPQEAIDSGIVMTDCHPAWDEADKLVLLDSVSVRDNCTTIFTVKYQVKDACSEKLSDTIYQIIHILDTVAPKATPVLLDTLVTYMNDVAGDCWGVAVDSFHTVADVKAYDVHFEVEDCNVGPGSRVELVHQDSSDVMCVRTVHRYYVVYDSCGLVSNEFVQTIEVHDTSAPTITAVLTPDTVYMSDVDECSFTHRLFPTISSITDDNMRTSITDCNLKDSLELVSVDTVPITGALCGKAVYVVYNAQDSCGRKTAFNDTIYVLDTIAPKVTGTLKLDTVYLAEDCTFSSTLPAAFNTTDDVNGHTDVTISDCNLVKELDVTDIDTVSFFCPMRLHRTYTVYDSCGNHTEFHQYYDVYDTMAPKVTDNTLDTLTLYIGLDSTYTVPAAYTLVDSLNAHGANITDCKLVNVIDSVFADTVTLNNVCDGSYVFREYYAADSCGNRSVAIHEFFRLADTISPWLNDTVRTYPAQRTANPCEFLVPNLHDTITAHYVDNWSGFNETYFSQPSAGHAITNFSDTIVKVVFGDACGNTDTVAFTITVPAKIEIDTIYATKPICNGDNNGTITVEVLNGVADYIYFCDVVDYTDTVSSLTHTFDTIPAGFYHVTVTDSNGCQATDTIRVNDRPALVITPIYPRDTCDNLSDTISISVAGGEAGYDVFAILFDDSHALLDTLFNEHSATYAALQPLDTGSYYISLYAIDTIGCVKGDTSDLITVHRTYLMEQTGRVCFTTVTTGGAGYDWYDANLVLRKHIPASVFTGPDSTYTLYDSLHTAYGCDSVYVMYLRVEDIPFFRVRRLSEAQADISNALPRDTIQDNFTMSSTNVGWEIFVDKNCMNCSDNIKVSIQYELYHKVGDTYELMGNVTDYFNPLYRTYLDNRVMAFYPPADNYTVANSNTVDIPSFYGPDNHEGFSYNYFKLCWLTPTYNIPCLSSYGTYDDDDHGTFYQGGRANTIKIQNFLQGGDYKIVVKLLRRTGGQSSGFHSFYGCITPESEAGGKNSTVVGEFANTLEIIFHVEGGASMAMPSTPSIGGAVTYNSNREVEATANVYPNPARDYITVELNGFEGQTSVTLSSTGGAVLRTVNLDIEDTHTTPVVRMETGDYAQGVYMVTVRNKDAIVTKRVVIVR